MTKAELANLLAFVTAYDHRTVGETDVEAWHLVIGDLDPTDCAEAIRQHFARSRDWLMPVDVRQGVARIRRDRLAAAGDPPPDANPDQPLAYRDALRANRHAIGNGTTKSRPVGQLTVGQRIPRPDYADAPRKAREHLAAAARQQVEEDPAVAADVAHRRAEARAELERLRVDAAVSCESMAACESGTGDSDA